MYSSNIINDIVNKLSDLSGNILSGEKDDITNNNCPVVLSTPAIYYDYISLLE